MPTSGQSRRPSRSVSRSVSRSARLVAVLAAAVLVFAACDSGDDGDSGAVDAGDTPAAEDGTDTGTGTEPGTENGEEDGEENGEENGEEDGEEDGAEPSGDADVTVTAVDIDFPTTEFTASAGEITIEYVNEGEIRHTLVIEGVDAWDTLTVNSNGDTATGTVELEAGEYTLFCDVPGHRGAGMEGTLTVS